MSLNTIETDTLTDTLKDDQTINLMPTDGIYEIKQEDSRLVITYKDGLKNGETLIYTHQDKLINKVTYLNDQLHGQATNYFANGNIEVTTMYKNNMLDGPMISYYLNGHKQCEGNFSKGKLENIFTFYDEYGDVSKKTAYKNGLEHGISTAYFPKAQGGGICQVNHYEDGLLIQDQDLFYASGELLQRTPYKKGKALAYPVPLDKQGKPLANPANKNRGG